MNKIHIVGAGMAGLLAANLLRRHEVIVFEKQRSLPNNHHAVLRFRNDEVGKLLGIPFRKVNMIKTYVPHMNPVADSLSYSRKATGKYLSDRSIITGTISEERYIAPSYFIKDMADCIHITYDQDYDFDASIDTKIISTMPMPLLMQKLGYLNLIHFDYVSGIVFTGTIKDCDAFVSVLFPGPQPYSRATITGNQLMIEFPNVGEVSESYHIAEVYNYLGLYDAIVLDGKFQKQEYFKIVEINDADRKKFQRWATVKHNVYSLGRYATWRPKLLLDDLVKDIHKIESWIVGGQT